MLRVENETKKSDGLFVTYFSLVTVVRSPNQPKIFFRKDSMPIILFVLLFVTSFI